MSCEVGREECDSVIQNGSQLCEWRDERCQLRTGGSPPSNSDGSMPVPVWSDQGSISSVASGPRATIGLASGADSGEGVGAAAARRRKLLNFSVLSRGGRKSNSKRNKKLKKSKHNIKMVRRTKRTKKRTKQRGGKISSGYYFGKSVYPGTGQPEVIGYTSCSQPIIEGMDSAFQAASNLKGGKKRRRKTQKRRKSRKSRKSRKKTIRRRRR